MKKIRFLDLSISDKKEKKQLVKIFSNLLKDGVFVLGNKVSKFEEKISKKLNKKIRRWCQFWNKRFISKSQINRYKVWR